MLFKIKHRLTGQVLFRIEAESFKTCLETAIVANIDLSYSDLSHSDLSHSDLSYSDLSHSDLRRSDLSHSDLRYSDLSYSDLRHSDLRHSDLRYSDLRRSDLSHSDLRYSDLSYSDLNGSDLIYMQLNQYQVFVQKIYTRIGCEYHKNEEWWRWTPEDVRNMSYDAEDFWRQYKSVVVAAIESLNTEAQK